MPQLLLRFVASCSLLFVLTTGALGQRGGPPPPPRAQAALDLTGYWVSLVTEDWRYRMTTPPKGDYAGVPLNCAGRQAAGLGSGEGRSGGRVVPRLRRRWPDAPARRLHITWQDEER